MTAASRPDPVAGQWSHVAAAWPSFVARAFARCDPDDQQRWSLFELLDALPSGPMADPPRRTSGTTGALGVMLDAVDRLPPADASCILRDVLEAWRPPGVTGLDADACRAGHVAVRLLVDGAEGPATDDDPALAGLPLEQRLEAIRAARPWPTNQVFEHVRDGDYTPDQVAVYLDQWQLHLRTGPALFTAILGNLPAGHPQRARLIADVAVPRRAGATERRTYLAGELGRLRAALTGVPSPDPIVPLPETCGHFGIMRALTRTRTPEEAFAAIWACKPSFPKTCASLAHGLVRHYGVDEGEVTFFRHQADRGDEGTAERAAVLRCADSDGARQDAIACAFADGLASYHLVLDGCHREALTLDA